MRPADKRGQLDAFEREVAWLTGYAQTWEDVVTASMDSTVGRAGRRMPWMPFSP